MADRKLEKHWKYYQGVWLSIFDEMSNQLRIYGFAPKGGDGKFEIGNGHGEVYIYPVAGSALADRLHMVEIYPSYTGNLLIKLTCPDRKELGEIDRQIQKTLKPMTFGKAESTKDGLFAGQYFFYREDRPDDPVVLGVKLLDSAHKWLETFSTME